MYWVGAIVSGLLLTVSGGAQAAEDGKFGATSRGSVGITLVKPEAVSAPSDFSVQMQRAGDVYLGATTQCLTGAINLNPTATQGAPQPDAGGAVLVQARSLGPCAGGGQAYRLLFMAGTQTGTQTSTVNPDGAVLLRPE